MYLPPIKVNFVILRKGEALTWESPLSMIRTHELEN